MSELCERCGWPKMVKDAPDWKLRCWWNFPDEGDSPLACLLRAHEREKARAEEAERDRDAWKRTAEVRAALLEGDDKPFREEIVDAQKDAAAAIARADRYEAEFCACKALLIAAQKRAERAEAERAEAKKENAAYDPAAIAAYGEQKAREARALALREAAEVCDAHDQEEWPIDGPTEKTDEDGLHAYAAAVARSIARDIRALAALPVEPARRQVTENANALGAPSARSPATPGEER